MARWPPKSSGPRKFPSRKRSPNPTGRRTLLKTKPWCWVGTAPSPSTRPWAFTAKVPRRPRRKPSSTTAATFSERHWTSGSACAPSLKAPSPRTARSRMAPRSPATNPRVMAPSASAGAGAARPVLIGAPKPRSRQSLGKICPSQRLRLNLRLSLPGPRQIWWPAC